MFLRLLRRMLHPFRHANVPRLWPLKPAVSTIIILVPASFCMVLTYRAETPSLFNVRAITFLLPVAAFVFVLSFIPLPPDLTSHNPLTTTTARLVVLGTTILGILSGLGSVNGAWSAFARKTSVASLSSVASAEVALERVKSDLRERTRNLDEYCPSKSQANETWTSRLTFKRDTPDRDSLQQEIVGLQALESQMASRIATLKRHRETAEFSESFRGKWLSRIWAMYCVCRVCSVISDAFHLISSAIDLLSPPSPTTGSSSYGDVIAHVLAYLLSLLPLDGARQTPGIDVLSLSRQISLALVGVIILSSIRVVLMGVMRVFRITSRSMSASLMLLFLAQLMGIYLLSTVVQLRTMFPPSITPDTSSGALPDAAEINLLSTLPEYTLFGGLFDWTFLAGAAGCALVRWAGGFFDNEMDLY
ncbi:Abscisic acid G-protein coupled receptor-domain-containing protein [Pisolithus croceorrhizus]|nr:Abscisic acid G-protein coupled receptor-domain-containing protein [Pisolithus croceorrhizus]KAI6134335.1 Abscisic acid G-protein coupled receptor-domain-containing protein [Pisolithus croceorrhizus]KAI6146534.1 Abscisic acid G-protein coupled receptor-domain-containing protein [Pisolithus thermaeus]